jgi:hypothetical protein
VDRFQAVPWQTLEEQFRGPVRAIVASVRASGAANRLRATNSMNALVVVAATRGVRHNEALKIYGPGSEMTSAEYVGIEHWSAAESFREFSERPVADAVEFFWDVVEEKLGIKRAGQ